MTTAMFDTSTRRILWWARSFGRPLQDKFALNKGDTPDEISDEFNELLEMADKRLADTSKKDEI